jgi:deoxyribodipyrimidine photo-lyase
MKNERVLVWVRRDLRLADHGPLAFAASLGKEVVVVFVFDPAILKGLPRSDRRVQFIHDSLAELDSRLREKGSRLVVRHGDPRQEIPALAEALSAHTVCTGKDYEPSAKKRDEAVATQLAKKGVKFIAIKDQVIFESKEVLSKTGDVYKMFTPYKNAWLAQLTNANWEKRSPAAIKFASGKELAGEVHPWDLGEIGFEPAKLWLKAGEKAGQARLQEFGEQIADYAKGRDFPALAGTSGLSVHLRFGTISIRECVRFARAHRGKGAEIWLSELIWRDFYHMILDQNPHVVGHAFRPEYEKIQWPGSNAHFQAWCEGRTGFPIVDAAMRHFNETGWMHNRLRMVVASFLTKDLLVDWRKGEEYFARYLLDFDLAANNGGWQWSASTGCDSQPYFRIFNPYSQSEKFDPEGEFIRANVSELKSVRGKEIHQPSPLLTGYPAPIVNHGEQRIKALALFKKG